MMDRNQVKLSLNGLSITVTLLQTIRKPNRMGQVEAWWHYHTVAFSTLLALCEGNPPVKDAFPFTKSQWTGPLMFPLMSSRINCCTNSPEAGDLRWPHCHVTSLSCPLLWLLFWYPVTVFEFNQIQLNSKQFIASPIQACMEGFFNQTQQLSILKQTTISHLQKTANS